MAKKDLINKGEALIEERQRIRDKMNAPLRKKLDWILSWQRNEHCQSLLGRWQLGEQVDEVYKDLEQQGGRTYGQNADTKLELFMHEDKSVLSQARRLYLAYPDKKRVTEICEMTMLDGVTPVSYSHIRQLLSIKDEDKRQEALNLALENCWTSAQLGAHIQTMHGGCRSNNPLGRASTPKTADAIIDQQISFADDFDDRNAKVWNDPEYSLSAQLEKVDPEDYTEELARKLGEVAQRMRQLAKDAERRAIEAEQKYTHVIRVLQAGKGKLKAVADLVIPDDESDGDDHLPSNPRGNRPVGRRARVA